MSEKRIFFISRAGADKRWAELIASVVRDAGHEPIYQDEHFRVGQSFIDNMSRAVEADCTIAVLSRAYFESEYCLSEINAALANDPLGRRGRVIPVRVEPVEIPSLLGQLAYLDLVGADNETARQRLMTTLLKHGQVDASKLALVGRTRRVVEQSNRNRDAMIEKVRTIWITDFLQPSIFSETRILLGLNERPDAVVRPMDLLVKRPDGGVGPLPSGTQVVDVYDSMNQALLILGEPGSGKTTLLLELARDLLDRAEGDASHPIPVIFPLSTWAASRKPLVQWLQDELTLRYYIPQAIAENWVESDEILPLLDGLDEVKAEHGYACVAVINAFRCSHGLLPMVITSRTADYDHMAKPLVLHGAILVQPLTHEQVNTYLIRLGDAGRRVREALHEDTTLWQLLVSPLLLNIIVAAYSSQLNDIPHAGLKVAERRRLVFDSYVKEMLRRRAAENNYTSAETVRWLSWLACHMTEHGQTVLYLERLQLSWLPQGQRKAVRFSYVLIGGLAVAVSAGLVAGIRVGLIAALCFVLVGGLMVGISDIPVVSYTEELSEVQIARLLAEEMRRRLPSILSVGLVGGLLGGVSAGPVVALVGAPPGGRPDPSDRL